MKTIVTSVTVDVSSFLQTYTVQYIQYWLMSLPTCTLTFSPTKHHQNMYTSLFTCTWSCIQYQCSVLISVLGNLVATPWFNCTVLQFYSSTRNVPSLKGQCHEIFDLYFFHGLNPSGPLINRIKWFFPKYSFSRRYSNFKFEKFYSAQAKASPLKANKKWWAILKFI